MALIAPNNLSPEYQCLDASNDIVFSWKCNFMPQYAYQLLIYKNSDDTLLFDTTQIISEDNTYTLSGDTIPNESEIKWKVILWSDASTSVDSEFILIKTALAPSVSITSVPTTEHEFEFVASVVLAASATIQKYKFLLYDNFNSVVYDSGYIYDYIPKHKITGLLPNFPYKVLCLIIDSNGQSAVSLAIPFTITSTISSLDLFTVATLNNFATVQIGFIPIDQTFGTVIGNYSFVEGKFGKGIKLFENAQLTYDKLVPQNFSLSLYCKLPTNYAGDIVILGDNNYRIFYNGQRWGYQFEDYITAGKIRSIPSNNFVKIIIKHAQLIVQSIDYTEII